MKQKTPPWHITIVAASCGEGESGLTMDVKMAINKGAKSEKEK